jgi:hypothetical protein
MPSFRHLGVVLTVVALVAAPVVAQSSAQKPAFDSAVKAATARVQHVSVRGTGDDMEIEIQTSGTPIAPDTQAITGPDRIVVDFPGALPAAELGALKVNRGPLKGVRSGLFFNNPPITRIVLDLAEPQSYKISSTQNTVVVRLGPAPAVAAQPLPARASTTPKFQNASLATTSGLTTHAAPVQVANVAASSVANVIVNSASNPVASAAQSEPPAVEAPPAPPPPPPVTVTFVNGLLRIHADKATLSQVLFEVQRQTQAEIAIPAGAEQEQVAADLGPAPAREVLGTLLNGSRYNFIFVGSESSLERVILTRRDSNNF